MKSLWTAILLSLLAVPVMAASPAPFSARYEVIRNGDRLGEATISFTALGDGRYQLLTNTIGTEGLAALTGARVEERSILSWHGDQPETLSYDYVQKLGWKTKERHLRVDAGSHRIDSQDKDQDYAPPYRAGVLDRNAITVALMQDIASGKTGDLLYFVPDRDQLVTQHYRSSAKEHLQTALGPEAAIRIERIRDSDNGRQTSLWLGPNQHYAPLRILQSEPNGETMEMRIISLH